MYRRQVTHSRSHSRRVAKLEPNLIWFWSQLCLYGQWLKHILLQQAEPPSGGPIVQLGGKGQLCPGASPLSKWLKRWAVFLGTFRKPGPAGQSGREDWARGRRAPSPHGSCPQGSHPGTWSGSPDTLPTASTSGCQEGPGPVTLFLSSLESPGAQE